MSETTKILRVDSSLNPGSSVSRALADKVLAKLESQGPTQVVYRDVSKGIQLITANWVKEHHTSRRTYSRTQANPELLRQLGSRAYGRRHTASL